MAQPDHPFRVLLLSAIGTRINPYIGLLQDGLAAAGAEVRLTDRLGPGETDGDFQPDVIHLHWLDLYDLPRAVALTGLQGATDLSRRALRRVLTTILNHPVVYGMRRWLRLRRLLSQLRTFQHRGGRVAYTVHNLIAHQGSGSADRWGTAALIRMADVVHVHDASTAEALATGFGRCTGVAVVPHGHYLNSYPNTIDRAGARSRLELPQNAFVYVTLGLMRPYKGMEELLPAFRLLPDPDARLVLAGQPGSPAYAQTLARQAAGDLRILFVPHFVPLAEVQFYLNAADVCVLPYRQITTSGAAILAFSFGLPVIAPALGAFASLTAGGRGVLYDPTNPTGLNDALVQARQVDWDATRKQRMEWVAQFDWEGIGRQLLAAYMR
jgi:beta-1,4-mannosyltransferase